MARREPVYRGMVSPAHRVETFAKAERKTKHEQEGLF